MRTYVVTGVLKGRKGNAKVRREVEANNKQEIWGDYGNLGFSKVYSVEELKQKG
jgi:hypothetical protein